MKCTTLLYCICLLLCGSGMLYAQEGKDTTLQEVQINAKRKISSDIRIDGFVPGQKIQTIDEATLRQYRLQSMADMLAQQSPVFIKSYGINGLATLNFRGSSAAQSQVMWNGVPLQNAALGVADVSILPVLFTNKVNILYGSSSALLGSGNVGGALLLENAAPVFDTNKNSLSINGGAGSYGQYSGALKGAIAGKRWYLSAIAFAQTATNNFAFTDANGMSEKMTNSRMRGYAGMVQAAYKIKERHTIGLSAWYQHYDRHIPPALFEAASVKEQADGSLRLLATWQKQNLRNEWYAKSSLIRDEVNYTDNAASLHSDNIAWQYYQEAGLKREIGGGHFLVFVPLQVLWMNLPITHELKQQNRIAIAAAYNRYFFNNRLNAAVNARAEAINEQSYFLPGANVSFQLTHWLALRANGQRTYRAPTLNELYYTPGGNPNLKPEQGWNEDAGYTLKLKYGNSSFYHDLSAFNRNIKDWIIWLGGAIWTPHNIASVHSRGIETDNKYTYNTEKWTFHISASTSYLLATTTQSYIANDGSSGKQIPYMPRYNGRANVGISYNRLSISYIHTYTGYRFTTSDETEYLLPYQTGNIQFVFNSTLHHYPIEFTTQFNNIWNEKYYIAVYRPMPGINLFAAIKLTIGHT